MGVSAVIIEDKTGLKKNSLFGTEVEQTRDSIENFFGSKLLLEKKHSFLTIYMIIAKIESLILERGMEDTLNRAFAFVKLEQMMYYDTYTSKRKRTDRNCFA